MQINHNIFATLKGNTIQQVTNAWSLQKGVRKLEFFFFFSFLLIMIETITQNVLYVYFSGLLSNRNVFNNSLVGNFYSMFFSRSFMIRIFTLALIIFHDRSFNIENFLWESSIRLLLGSTWLLILLLKYDWAADNYSVVHPVFTATFRPSTFARSEKNM